VIVGPNQVEFAQYALNNLYTATGIASGLTTFAVQRRTNVIGSVGIEPPLDSARGQSQNLAPRGGFDGFEIQAIGGATTQQRIQITGDVVSQFGGERIFFLNRLQFPRSRSASHRSFRSLPPDRL
jgi:hypothetical protein